MIRRQRMEPEETPTLKEKIRRTLWGRLRRHT